MPGTCIMGARDAELLLPWMTVECSVDAQAFKELKKHINHKRKNNTKTWLRNWVWAAGAISCEESQTKCMQKEFIL